MSVGNARLTAKSSSKGSGSNEQQADCFLRASEVPEVNMQLFVLRMEQEEKVFGHSLQICPLDYYIRHHVCTADISV